MDGIRLKQVREERELSQQELADRVGVTNKQIWRYENGLNLPTADVLARMAKELSVSMDYLAGLVDEPQGRAGEDRLSPNERKILSAYRRGDLSDLMRILADIDQE
jgi:transcriptional regulator with XRE-family HTH domain